jgi:hypothetical protein
MTTDLPTAHLYVDMARQALSESHAALLCADLDDAIAKTAEARTHLDAATNLLGGDVLEVCS